MKDVSAKARKKLVLLDSHAILHRAYHALPDFSTAKGEPTGALYGLSTMLIKIVEDLKPDYLVACYDVKGPTYRHEAYKDYKAGRQKAEEDLIAQIIRSRDVFEAFNVPIYEKEGFEADDMLGTIVEQLKNDSGLDIVIASGDMDTLQLINGTKVQVYTLKKGIKDTVIYDEEAVRERFGFGPELIADYKGLRGDPSDNIVGVKGIGEVTATSLITTFGTIESIYQALRSGQEEKFAGAGISPRIVQLLKDNQEEAEFSKMLATIRRDAPISFVLPAKTFRDGLEVKKVELLWKELEFRTLPQRLLQLLNKWDGKVIEKPRDQTNFSAEKPRSGGEILVGRSGQGALFGGVSSEEIEKVGLALWLVRSNLTNPQMEDILQFAETDDFVLAKSKILAELKEKKLERVYEEIELPLIPITHAMEKRGIKIDRVELHRLGATYHLELDRLEKRIWELAGTEFNINSPRQLGDVLFDRLGLKGKNMKKTGGGARSTKESELEKLRDQHPIVPLLFEYRELSKLLSTYIDAIPPLLDLDNRLHSDFIPSGTTTGRMASQNPNLQNIPIKSSLGKAVRKAFVAEKGFVLAGFDYSQMELRIAAFLSGDKKLIEIFQRGEDIHTSVASLVFGVDRSAVTPEMRRQAKVINFGIIYGMGVMALKQNLGTSREEAQQFLNGYFESFSGLAEYLGQVKAETAKRGYTETFFGRRRYFEGINSKIPYIKAQAERMAINAPIQGTEADIIKLAMIRIDAYLRENSLIEDVYPLLQVHDELIYEIRDSKVEEVVPVIEKIMESVIDPDKTKGVVMKSSAATASNWGDLK